MKNIFLSFLIALTAVPAFINAVRPPGADTPAFYLVSTSQSSDPNLKPVRTNGGAGGYASLTGSAPIGIFYFFQGSLVAVNSLTSTTRMRPLIGSVLGSTGCSTYGQLGFVEGSSSNKCARYNTFNIQSNQENSQLGAKLVFNFVGGFYSCGSGQDIWYQASPSEAPPGLTCTPIDLYTVPVV